MQKRGRFFAANHIFDFVKRQNRTHFVVDRHKAYQNRVLVDRFFELLRCYVTVFVRLYPYDFKALFFQTVHANGHARVLNRRGHHTVAGAAVLHNGAENRGVICHCAARRKINFTRFGRKAFRNSGAGRFQEFQRRKPVVVQRRRVAERRCHRLCHGFNRGFARFCCRAVVEIAFQGVCASKNTDFHKYLLYTKERALANKTTHFFVDFSVYFIIFRKI